MRKINFLVLGSGAREHAIADKLLQSAYINQLFLADANDGFAHLGEKIEYTDFSDLAIKAKTLNVEILVVGPENPLCEGITDVFKNHGIAVIGVDKYWSQLESSKIFAKRFMEKHGIKTAKYNILNNLSEFNPPYVIKADGLCKGKGVSIAESTEEAQKIINEYLNGKFGEASKKLLIEEFIEGEEVSLMSLWDGQSLLHFLPARDFKRINSDPTSLNTGGMGAFCPVQLSDIQETRLSEYKLKLKNALKAEKANFTGFIYSGLIWNNKKEDFYVLEYNVRLGDPETQAILTVLKSDLGEIFIKAQQQKLGEIHLRWAEETAACLVIAAEGYPIMPKDKEKITIPELNSDEVKLYFAGVKKLENDLYSSGGRILSICSTGVMPFVKAVEIADNIELENKYYRQDLNV